MCVVWNATHENLSRERERKKEREIENTNGVTERGGTDISTATYFTLLLLLNLKQQQQQELFSFFPI